MPRLVEIAPEATADRSLLGGKASSLVELMRLGAPVPPGFVLTTDAYHEWATGAGSDVVAAALSEGVGRLEAATGRRLGGGADGLVVSVRSGAPVSMPGMMDTVLNVGLGELGDGDDVAHLRVARERFVWQLCELVLELDTELVGELRAEARAWDDLHTSSGLARLDELVAAAAKGAGRSWPSDAAAELHAAVEAVLRSWDSKRARLYRRMRGIDDTLGTAVTVQQMVFGNRDELSGTGVAFSRDPNDGARGLAGEYLAGGQGEDVVAGVRTPEPIAAWRAQQPDAHARLEALAARLERDGRAVQEIEFTVESGALYVLQSRPAKLTARAAVRAAVDMEGEGVLTRAQAVEYATGHGFDPRAAPRRRAVRADAAPAGGGLPVGGGVRVGRLALDERQALAWSGEGSDVVFAAEETSPSHLDAMRRSVAVVTMHGGATSHAAVVARELGIAGVVGTGGHVEPGVVVMDRELRSGETVTVDGDGGAVYAGDVADAEQAESPEDETLRGWLTTSPDARSSA